MKSPAKSPMKSPAKSPRKSPAKSPAKDTSSSPVPASPEKPEATENPCQPAVPEIVVENLANGHLPAKDEDVDEANTTEYDDKMSDVRSVYSDTDDTLPHTKYDDEPVDALTCPSGRWKIVRFSIMYPIRVLYYLTIPDCRLANWESWYIVTFLMSITWMGLHSYVLVWAVSVIGVTISIPECIMGLTLLAAGSSIPDAIASLVMAEQGMGDMALANAIGSNIFDMLCLSIPWLLSTTVVHRNSQVLIHGGNICVRFAHVIWNCCSHLDHSLLQ